MFRTFARRFLPNILDWKLKRAARRGAKSVLICWNRGLGDIPLGVAAIVHRIRHFLPSCKISVLTRENLRDGFSLLERVEVLVDPRWKRGEPCDLSGVDLFKYDLILEKPDPNEWCAWQRKTFTPRLKWNEQCERRFDLPSGFTYIGVQAIAETNYGLWRNWPKERWDELFEKIGKLGSVRVLLFGYGSDPVFSHPCIIDLRGKTSFFELVSVIKKYCSALVLPDSGILATAFYLDESFPIHVVSLFADPRHGILKQGVASPNPQLVHTSLISELRDLSTISADQVFEVLFPKKVARPLWSCPKAEEVIPGSREKTACVILAGGQGTRLGFNGPKGLYEVLSKPLFLHHMEKICKSMPVAVMTSPLNHAETVAFFELHGLKVHFFQQKMVDLLDENYEPIGFGPDGNGGVYQQLVSSGILDQFEAMGIETLIVTPVDNPLADPADARLIGAHLGADVTIKCVERIRGESMGALTETGIIEYFDIDEDIYSYSYMGQVALSTQFVRKAAKLDLPPHWVWKNSAWKRERFLFDAFVAAEKIQALCYDRNSCYGPIKGPDSLVVTEKLLLDAL